MVEGIKNGVMEYQNDGLVCVKPKCPKCDTLANQFTAPQMTPGNEWKQTLCNCPNCGELFECIIRYC